MDRLKEELSRGDSHEVSFEARPVQSKDSLVFSEDQYLAKIIDSVFSGYEQIALALHCLLSCLKHSYVQSQPFHTCMDSWLQL